MFGDEAGIFLSTKIDGQAKGFGDTIIELNIPPNKLELDDVFGDEAHLKIPTKNIGDKIDISNYLK